MYRFQTYLQRTVGHGYRLFVNKVKNLLPEDCKSEIQSVYKVSEPTSRELSAWVQPFYMVSKPTSRGLSAGNAAFCFTCLEPTSKGVSSGVHRVFTASNLPPKGCLCYVLVIFLFNLVGVLS